VTDRDGLVDYWLFGNGSEELFDPLLPHVSDQQIRAIGDSYDDGRINALAEAYIKLRNGERYRRDVLDGDH
jgi:hypothetical protein